MEKNGIEYKVLILAGLQILQLEKNTIKNLDDISLVEELIKIGCDIDISSDDAKLTAGCKLVEDGLWRLYEDKRLSAEEKAVIGDYVWKIVSGHEELGSHHLSGIMRSYIIVVTRPLVPVLQERLADAERRLFGSFAAGGVAQQAKLNDATVVEKIAYLWNNISFDAGLTYLDHSLEHGNLPRDDSWFEELFEIVGEVGGDALRMKFTEHCLAMV